MNKFNSHSSNSTKTRRTKRGLDKAKQDNYTFHKDRTKRRFFCWKMYKERRRPNLDQRLKEPVVTCRSSEKRVSVDLELRNCDLIDNNGVLKQEDFLADAGFQPLEIDRAQEIETEVGISVDVLEAFAEEQRKVPFSNTYAFLDQQFPIASPDSPRTIISDDYSEDSRP